MFNTATPSPAALVIAVLLVLASVRASAVAQSFAFVAERLPEVAMDNRFATLPLRRPEAHVPRRIRAAVHCLDSPRR
jgi:hypothetical protein